MTTNDLAVDILPFVERYTATQTTALFAEEPWKGLARQQQDEMLDELIDQHSWQEQQVFWAMCKAYRAGIANTKGRVSKALNGF